MREVPLFAALAAFAAMLFAFLAVKDSPKAEAGRADAGVIFTLSSDVVCRPCPVCPKPTGNDAMAE